jgi:beta-lactamase class A
MILKSYSKVVTALLLAPLSIISLSLSSQAETSATLPLRVRNTAWRHLYQHWDQGLQAKLGMALKREPLWQALIDDGKMAVSLVDLADSNKPRFAQVNGNTMMYAASLSKIAILLAAFQGFQDGSLKETPQIRADLIEMIRRSDNFAASRVVARIGLKKIERIILEPRYRFYDTKQGGGIWVGGSFARDGEQNPEPLKNLIQAATVNQVCRFYCLLAYGRLINPESSRQMLKILAFPDLHDKFVSVLEGAVPPNRLYRKSGEFGIWYSDSILVWGQTWQRYILVSMVEHQQGEQILRKLVPKVENILRPRQPAHNAWGR